MYLQYSHLLNNPLIGQAQLYYAGASFYIGRYNSKKEAFLAHEIARELMETEKNITVPRIKANIDLARKVVSGTATNSENTGKMPPVKRQVGRPRKDGQSRLKEDLSEKDHPGVDRNKGKWRARIYFSRKSRYIGLFDTQEAAISSHEAAVELLKNASDEEIKAYDNNNEAFRTAVERKQNCNPFNKKRPKTNPSSKVQRELDKLGNHNIPGPHDFIPLQRSSDEKDVSQSLRSRHGMKEVMKSCWDEKESGMSSEQPIHYCSIPYKVATLAKQVKKELLERRWNGRGDLLKTWDEVDPHHIPGYFKGHMTNETSFEFEDCIPSSFELKESASQLGIVFLNTQDGICDTHYDRDSSMLYLVSGCKEVKIATTFQTMNNHLPIP